MFDVLILTSVAVIKETEKAILISGFSNSTFNESRFMQAWLAKSILTVSEDEVGVTITLPEWYNNKFQACA